MKHFINHQNKSKNFFNQVSKHWQNSSVQHENNERYPMPCSAVNNDKLSCTASKLKLSYVTSQPKAKPNIFDKVRIYCLATGYQRPLLLQACFIEAFSKHTAHNNISSFGKICACGTKNYRNFGGVINHSWETKSYFHVPCVSLSILPNRETSPGEEINVYFVLSM